MIKLFSFLGTSNYNKTKYYLDDETGCFECETAFVQEALIDYLLKQIKADEQLQVNLLLTRCAREVTYESQTEATGFSRIQDKYGKQVIFSIIDVEDGKNELENWENFNRITETVNDKDVIYMDITHGFRSLPFLESAMLNYVRITLSDVSIAGIYYGAFEAKDDNNRTPILKLEEFIQIQAWSYAVDKFLTSGNGEVFELLNQQIRLIRKKARATAETIKVLEKIGNALKIFMAGLKSNRVEETIEAALETQDWFEKLKAVETARFASLRPFFKLLQKLETMVADYREDDLIFNMHLMTRQCLNFGMYQQVFTLVQENMLNCVMQEICTREELYLNHNLRDEVSCYYRAICKNEAKDLDLEKLEYYRQNIPRRITRKDHYGLYSDGLRNDLNHAGLKDDPLTVKKVVARAEERVEKFETLFLLSENKAQMSEK